MSENLVPYAKIELDARGAAKEHLRAAIDSVNELMGEGAASANPALVAELVRAAAADYSASMLSHRIAPALALIADGIRELADAVRGAASE